MLFYLNFVLLNCKLFRIKFNFCNNLFRFIARKVERSYYNKRKRDLGVVISAEIQPTPYFNSIKYLVYLIAWRVDKKYVNNKSSCILL